LIDCATSQEHHFSKIDNQMMKKKVSKFSLSNLVEVSNKQQLLTVGCSLLKTRQFHPTVSSVKRKLEDDVFPLP
jgi:hypothetical protein